MFLWSSIWTKLSGNGIVHTRSVTQAARDVS
jgi:hypothetical protein